MVITQDVTDTSIFHVDFNNREYQVLDAQASKENKNIVQVVQFFLDGPITSLTRNFLDAERKQLVTLIEQANYTKLQEVRAVLEAP